MTLTVTAPEVWSWATAACPRRLHARSIQVLAEKRLDKWQSGQLLRFPVWTSTGAPPGPPTEVAGGQRRVKAAEARATASTLHGGGR